MAKAGGSLLPLLFGLFRPLLVRFLEGFEGDLLQWNGDTVATLTPAQAFISKTFDISANTLKTATNTAGHVPRNNGTQYADSTLACADLSNATAACSTALQGTDSKLLTSGTVSGTGAALCTDANGGATTSGCTAGGVSETIVSGTVTSGVCGSGSPSNCAVVFIPANAHRLTRLVSVVTTAGSGCSANSQWAIIDLSNSNAVLASGTPSNIVGTVTDSGALSVAMTAAHRFALGQANNPTGCTTFEAAIISANFQ